MVGLPVHPSSKFSGDGARFITAEAFAVDRGEARKTHGPIALNSCLRRSSPSPTALNEL